MLGQTTVEVVSSVKDISRALQTLHPYRDIRFYESFFSENGRYRFEDEDFPISYSKNQVDESGLTSDNNSINSIHHKHHKDVDSSGGDDDDGGLGAPLGVLVGAADLDREDSK
jgi:hypothetical protein